MKILIYHEDIEKIRNNFVNYPFHYEDNYENVKNIINKYDALIAFGLGGDINLSGLKWIHSLGAGVDWVLSNKTLNKDCLVTRITEGFGQSIFEYVLSRLLFYYQNIKIHEINQKSKTWHNHNRNSISILNKKVLIIGIGKIGQYLAENLKNIGSEVYGINSDGSRRINFTECYSMANLDYNISFDTVICTLPDTDKTHKVLNRDFFNRINTDVFINVGRGNTIEEDSLIHELKNGKIKIAFLDVFENEPLSTTSNLWDCDNLFITPHIAGLTTEEQIVTSVKKYYKLITTKQSVEDSVNIKRGY